jgi:hypothetical protein
MPLQDDDEICFCFHVTLRTVRNLSAGTGCGWCRPMLRKIHKQECDVEEPWWRKVPDEPAAEYHSAERDADAAQLDSEHYAAGRRTYLKETGRRPPPPGDASSSGS